MKVSHFITEKVKLYAYLCLITFLALSLFLNHTNHNVNFFNVSFTLPNLTRTNLQILEVKRNHPIIDNVNNNNNNNNNNINVTKQNTSSANHNIEEKICNIFEGEWIYEPEELPIYNASQCPFLGEQVSCKRNGRPDFEYEKWRWEAKGCNNIPRNDTGKQILEKLRGKRAIIVGDSLNRNQWESLACILYTALPPSRTHVDAKSGDYKVIKAKEYNISVEFYWNPFLVQLDLNKTDGKRVLKLDKISASAKMWKGADIMVFNTGHWWTHQGKLQPWDSFFYKGKETEQMEIGSALSLAMKTWSRWVQKNVDTTKTRVFFRSISPEHKATQWCYNQTQPIMDESFIPSYSLVVRQTVESRIQEMKSLVTYLNITKLSGYRKDAHPSIYRTKNGKKLVAKNKIKPEKFADCSHWCLPGLPDTWNSLLFATIPFEASKNISTS